jgi:hypothetical protein
VKAGIAPQVLVAQVKGTAGWLWDEAGAMASKAAAGAVRVLDGVDEVARVFPEGPRGTAYLRLLLAAHFATVATFVPTDVDARIRHHAWWAMEEADVVEAGAALVDEVASWDAGAVSARVLAAPEGALSGHDGEWLGVRAGALGRAVSLGADRIAGGLAAALDGELDREERILTASLEGDAPASRALAAATIVAHNLGDLSRVVEAWPKLDALAPLRARYLRLGHDDAPTRRRPFVIGGALNKALVAHENHRFLPLRRPRGLRRARALLLPIGPWLDAWGETVARHDALDERDRAEVVAALLEIHRSAPEQLGCLRALSGIHRATRGGLDVFSQDLPARLRKDPRGGRVREALDVEEAHFVARFERRYAAERARVAREVGS